MKMRLVMLAAAVSMGVVSATNAFAQQPDCKSIQDPKARLECFDAAPAHSDDRDQSFQRIATSVTRVRDGAVGCCF